MWEFLDSKSDELTLKVGMEKADKLMFSFRTR